MENLPLLSYVLPAACSFGVDPRVFIYCSGGTGMAIGYVFSVIVALVGCVFLFTHKIVNMLRDGELKFSKCKSELISLFFALLLLVSLLFPVISVNAALKINSRTTEDTLKIGYSDITEPTSADIRFYLSGSSHEQKIKLYDDLRMAGRQDNISETVLDRVMVACGRIDPSILYIAVFLINSFVLLVFATLCSRLVKKAFYSIPNKRIMSLKVMLMILALSQCVVLFIICIFANESIGLSQNLALNFKIGAGPIFSLICALGILVSSDRNKDDEKLIDTYYDNPDVSYAPYVVGYKNK